MVETSEQTAGGDARQQFVTGGDQLKLEGEERRKPTMTIGRIIGAMILIALIVAIVVVLADQGF